MSASSDAAMGYHYAAALWNAAAVWAHSPREIKREMERRVAIGSKRGWRANASERVIVVVGGSLLFSCYTQKLSITPKPNLGNKTRGGEGNSKSAGSEASNNSRGAFRSNVRRARIERTVAAVRVLTTRALCHARLWRTTREQWMHCAANHRFDNEKFLRRLVQICHAMRLWIRFGLLLWCKERTHTRICFKTRGINKQLRLATIQTLYIKKMKIMLVTINAKLGLLNKKGHKSLGCIKFKGWYIDEIIICLNMKF